MKQHLVNSNSGNLDPHLRKTQKRNYVQQGKKNATAGASPLFLLYKCNFSTFVFNSNLPITPVRTKIGVLQYVLYLQDLRWTQLPLTGLRKFGYKPWGFSILFRSFLMFITCRDTGEQMNINRKLRCHSFHTFSLFKGEKHPAEKFLSKNKLQKYNNM